jgi:hypothetical protein
MKFNYFAWASRHSNPTGHRYTIKEHAVYLALSACAVGLLFGAAVAVAHGF